MAKLDISQSLSQHFEPKRQNRFYVEIDGIPSWMVKNFQRPKPSNGSIEIDYLNNKRYLAGKTSMASITLTLHDPLEKSSAQAIHAWQKAVYDPATGRSGYSDDYAKTITVKELSPELDIVSEVVFHRAFPTDVDFGSYDYSSAEPIEVSLTIQYDSYEVVS